QYGPVIDAVNISVVPEVSTWAMLIAGFSLVGLTSRRRNRAAVAA
ncbi:MAG: PEPxxWA-CTERM sorting domain-containing protein, partial [Sandarakinorhabdus sp.]|nr:PEPxxWA-CTERM sorting domain-containing protein [Sandarakinorhabdus sp.]